VKVPNLSPLKLFSPALAQPSLALAGVGGTEMFASGRDDDGYDLPDRGSNIDQPTARAPRASRGGSGGSGSGGSGGGRQRTIQFQPEERYWTEYLRIALPIIGLLLMVGLFWYWAERLINDSADADEPVATANAGLAELEPPASTPEPTSASVVETDGDNAGETPAPAATRPPADEAQDSAAEEDAATEEPAADDGAAEDAAFAAGDSARINDDGVNMRTRPTTGDEGTIVASLDSGTIVSIQSGPEEADDYTWWEIVVEDTGESGWVVEQYLDAAE
jgi:hypothetical protein